MATTGSAWDDWAAEVEHCLDVVRTREEYAARIAALRRLRELAADAEAELAHDRFVPIGRRRSRQDGAR